MGEPIFLLGEASEVGAVQGQWQQAVLRERIGRVLQRADEIKTLGILRERAEKFSNCLLDIAPHWLEEASVQARVAGVEAWQLLAINCLPGNFWPGDGALIPPAPLSSAGTSDTLVNAYEAQGIDPGMGGGDCTTFFGIGDACLGGETLFHKNREHWDEVQCLYIKQINGFNRFVGGGDIGNLGTAHLHTEDFWVGANNTGSSVPPEEYEDCVLTDSHTLRYLAERCASLDEIVPAMEQLIARNYLGGGSSNAGMIMLFADAARGLIVESTSRRLAFRWFEESDMAVRTNHFVLPEMQEYCLPPNPGSLRRFERATELWEPQHGIVGIAGCGEIARDRDGAPSAICRNSTDGLGSVTVSTSTATLSSGDERRCQTHFRNCHPSYTPAIILTPLDRVSDSELVSGAHNQEWRNYRGWV